MASKSSLKPKARSHEEMKYASAPSSSLSLALCAQPAEDRVFHAIQSLMNTRKVAEASATPQFDPSVLMTLRGMFNSDQKYQFRMSKVSTLTNGTAVLQVNVATDLTVYQEGAALAALFDECRLVRTRWELVLLTHTTQFGFMIAYEPIVTTVAPTAVILTRLPHSKICTTVFGKTVETASYDLEYGAHKPLWGMTIDEGVSAPRLRSGLNGTFRIAHIPATITPTTSEINFNYRLITIAELRSRA